MEALEKVEIAAKADNRPAQLSGGQQQRVAIARAIAARSPILMADEPTGALDSRTGEQVLGLMRQMNAEGTTVIADHRRQRYRGPGRPHRAGEGWENRPRQPVGRRAGGLERPAGAGGAMNALRMALDSIREKKGRSFLTMLGIIIGVTAVLVLVALVSGYNADITAYYEKLGVNKVNVTVNSYDTAGLWM